MRLSGRISFDCMAIALLLFRLESVQRPLIPIVSAKGDNQKPVSERVDSSMQSGLLVRRQSSRLKIGRRKVTPWRRVRLSSLTIAEGQQDVRLESLTHDAGERHERDDADGGIRR